MGLSVEGYPILSHGSRVSLESEYLREANDLIIQLKRNRNVSRNISPSSHMNRMNRINSYIERIIFNLNTYRRIESYISFPYEKTVYISKKRLNSKCQCECGICWNYPLYKETIRTSCKHYYCNECWTTWMKSSTSVKECPLCRNNKLIITRFGEKKVSNKKIKLIIEDDDIVEIY